MSCWSTLVKGPTLYLKRFVQKTSETGKRARGATSILDRFSDKPFEIESWSFYQSWSIWHFEHVSLLPETLRPFLGFSKKFKISKMVLNFFRIFFYELWKSSSFMSLLKTILKISASFLNYGTFFSNWFFHNFEKIKFQFLIMNLQVRASSNFWHHDERNRTTGSRDIDLQTWGDSSVTPCIRKTWPSILYLLETR